MKDDTIKKKVLDINPGVEKPQLINEDAVKSIKEKQQKPGWKKHISFSFSSSFKKKQIT